MGVVLRLKFSAECSLGFCGFEGGLKIGGLLLGDCGDSGWFEWYQGADGDTD